MSFSVTIEFRPHGAVLLESEGHMKIVKMHKRE